MDAKLLKDRIGAPMDGFTAPLNLYYPIIDML